MTQDTCCCRAATHSTPSLHQTLRRLNKELIQADQSAAAAPVLSDKAVDAELDKSQTASTAASRAASSPVPGQEALLGQNVNSGSESSGARYAYDFMNNTAETLPLPLTANSLQCLPYIVQC